MKGPPRRLGLSRLLGAARTSGAFRVLSGPENLWRRVRSRKAEGFNEKVRYKMARDRRPILTTFADKLEAKEYVKQTIGPEYAPVTLAQAGKASDLPWVEMPEEFVAKVNHGCGACVISWRGAEADARVPEPTLSKAWTRAAVKPPRAKPAEISAFLDMHLALSFDSTLGEWAYRAIRPRAFIEEFLPGEGGRAPLDYRMYCFGGRCEVAMVISFQVMNPNPTGARYLCDFFDRDWVHLDGLRQGAAHHDKTPTRPKDFDQMIAIADALSTETDFLRVDLIRSNGRVLVSELTNYPNAGRVPIIPFTFEQWLGKLWSLPRDYSTLPQGTYPLRAESPTRLA